MDFTQNLKAFLKQLPLKKMSGHRKIPWLLRPCSAEVTQELK